MTARGLALRSRHGLRLPSAAGVGLTLLVVVVSLLLALVALSANPIAVALGAAMLLAPILIARPTLGIWAILLSSMLVAGTLPIWTEGSATKVVWAISMLSFLLLFVVLVRALVTPGFTRGTPAFVWIALALMVFAVFTTLLQWSTAYEALSGIKRYFQAFGLLFALAWLPLEAGDFRRWRRFFVFVAAIQLPWAIYERIRLVPIREGFKGLYPGLVPIDVVSGTFGANMTQGGASGAMAAFLILMLAFLLARWREGLLHGTRMLMLGLLVTIPVFLGETKIAVVLLPLTFALLYRRELLRRPHLAVLGLCVGAALTIGTVYAYLAIMDYRSLAEYFVNTLAYNFQDRGHGGFALNRTTALHFWWVQQSWADPLGAVLGNGLGSAHDLTGGHIARRHIGYGVGITAASSLLWDLGAVGFSLALALPLSAWYCASRLVRHARDAMVRADAAAIEVAMLIFVVFLFYRTDAIQTLTFQIVFACLFGYLAWLHRHTGVSGGPQ